MAITIYSDESGTHDNRFLIIAALITDSQAARKRIKNLMSRKLIEYKKPNMEKELHSYALTIPERQNVLNLMSLKHDYKVAYLVADKNHLVPELRQRPNLCYNFLFNILFKRLIMSFNDDICIIGDNRTVAAGSKNSLPEYIKTEAYAKWGYKYNLSLEFMDSCSVKGLQAADLLASAIYARCNLDKSHLYNLHYGHYIERVLFPYAKFNT